MLDDTETRETEAPPAWAFTEYGVTILRDISWEECETLWSTADRLHRNVNWIIGDVMVSCEEIHGERFSQLLDGFQVEQRSQAKWVAKRFPQSRRQRWMPAVSWTLFRECSALEDDADQERLLDQAAADGWRTKDMIAARKALQAERTKAAADYPRNGAPPIDEPEAPDVHPPLLDGEDDEDQPGAGAEPEAASRGRCEDNVPTAASLGGGGRTGGSIPPTGASADIHELRTCLVLIHTLAGEMAEQGVGEMGAQLQAASRRITEACGVPGLPLPLGGDIAPLWLIPEDWDITIKGRRGGSFVVELVKPGAQLAVGLGPMLITALTEAALAARISDQQG